MKGLAVTVVDVLGILVPGLLLLLGIVLYPMSADGSLFATPISAALLEALCADLVAIGGLAAVL